MTIPPYVAEAAQDGEVDVVKAWLDEAGPGSINAFTESRSRYTLLQWAACPSSAITQDNVIIAKMLIARGIDVNLRAPNEWSPLHYACYPGSCSAEMVRLLLQSGAQVDARTGCDYTPLGIVMDKFSISMDWQEPQQLTRLSALEITIALLRAGASLNRCHEDRPIEEIMRSMLIRHPELADDEDYIKSQELVAGVRAHGSYKRYARAPHRQFLRLRSLLIRRREERTNRLLLERLRTERSWGGFDRPVWKSAELHLLQRLARLPNGPCWNVLSYWREAE